MRMSFRDTLRALIPTAVLEWNRARKKNKVRALLEAQRTSGAVWTKEDLVEHLRNAGVETGRDLLVHSSLSAIGYVEGGPATIVEALLEVIGPEATLLMPTSPVVTLQAEHALEEFDPKLTPSKMGAITEYFRAHVATHRSAHPLEPVGAVGPKAQWYTADHLADGTSYGPSSPWNRHMEQGGQILYIGTTLVNSGTSLHAVEDAIGWEGFSFPVYLPEPKVFKVRVNGVVTEVASMVHNPAVSALRKCDGLIPVLEQAGALKKVNVGKAASLLVDAGQMKSLLLKAYYERGVTMYTPEGQ